MKVGNLLERVLKQFSVKLCEIKVECNTYNEVYYKVMLFKGFRHVETYFVQLNTSVFANLVCVPFKIMSNQLNRLVDCSQVVETMF